MIDGLAGGSGGVIVHIAEVGLSPFDDAFFNGGYVFNGGDLAVVVVETADD